jgi:protein involved in polysaccharide export with SLBB domain
MQTNLPWLLVAMALACAVGPARAQLSARKIQANDILAIRVVSEPELTLDKKVESDGKIDYPYLGQLQVVGLTTAELRNLIQERLNRDYYVDPQVSVDYREYSRQGVNVVGQVNKPGRVELPADRRIDIVEALTTAGDLSAKAKRSEIYLIRKGEPRRYSYDELIKISDPDKKIYLDPDDVIEVKERVF